MTTVQIKGTEYEVDQNGLDIRLLDVFSVASEGQDLIFVGGLDQLRDEASRMFLKGGWGNLQPESYYIEEYISDNITDFCKRFENEFQIIND